MTKDDLTALYLYLYDVRFEGLKGWSPTMVSAIDSLLATTKQELGTMLASEQLDKQ